MDAIELLLQDHRKVEQLFMQASASNEPSQARQIAAQIDMELTVHAEIEEKIFYPAIRQLASDLIKEAYHEHGEVKMLLNEIAGADSASPEAKKQMLKLQKAVEHHVKEEEGQLFSQVRQGLDQRMLMQLGQQMLHAKQEGLKVQQTLIQQKLGFEGTAISMPDMGSSASMPTQI